jgi:AcrR family transcriptional regulator
MTLHDWDRAPTAAEARRWQLLTAGRRAIMERGLDALTVEDVVKRAGLAKGSFYTYFESRDLFLDALRYALSEDVGETTHQAAAGPWVGLFGRMMRATARWQLENRPLLDLFGLTYMANPERPTRIPLVAILERILGAGAEAGVLRALASRDGSGGLPGTAAIVLDVMREAGSRAVVTHPDETPIEEAERFLERALGFDPRKARSASYEPPAP